MNQQKMGGFLKHLRKENGLTQEQLAERFFVSSRTVSRWETGSNMPDVIMLMPLLPGCRHHRLRLLQIPCLQ